MLCAELGNMVDATNDFAVDFSKNLSAENVGEFGFSVESVNSL